MWPPKSRGVSQIFSCAVMMDADPFSAASINFRQTRTGAITSSSTNTFTATAALVWERIIKQAGRDSWRSCCNRAANKTHYTGMKKFHFAVEDRQMNIVHPRIHTK